MGRNTNMLIGMVVDTSGLIPKKDSLVFDSLGKKIKFQYQHPVVKLKNSQEKKILLSIPASHTISRVVIQEDISKGENIRSYVIQAYIDNKWQEIARGESVGHKRIQVFKAVNTRKIRFEIKQATGRLFLKEIAFY